MIGDVCHHCPGVMDSRSAYPQWQPDNGKPRVALRNWLFRVAADSLPRASGDLDFADDIPGVVEIICYKKLCLGLAVDPDDDPLALPTVDGAHTEAKARAVFSIVPDSAVLDPVWIELLVAARPPVQMVGPKAGDV